jgi:hypothetical protein
MSARRDDALHVRLLQGLNFGSRDDDSVHTIKGADGRTTVAEVCVGSTVTRLNFREPPTVPVPAGVVLSGRSQSWRGGGVQLTPWNFDAARELLLAVVGARGVAPAAPTIGIADVPEAAGSDDAIRGYLESVFGSAEFRLNRGTIELDLTSPGENRRESGRFTPPPDWTVLWELLSDVSHAVGLGEASALCGLPISALAQQEGDAELEPLICRSCRLRLIAIEIASVPGRRGQNDEARRVLLHDEIARILRDAPDAWMTTDEIASAVNTAGRYRKRDGTDVTAFHVHGRTRNYPTLFERQGSRVRLRDSTLAGPPGFAELIEHMDALAEAIGLDVESVRTGKNYRPAILEPGAEFNVGIGVYTTRRGVEFNMQVFRDRGEDDIADDLVDRIRRVTGWNPGGTGLWPAVPCETLVRDWPRARSEVIEPYFRARLQLSAPAAATMTLSTDGPTTRVGYRNRNGQVVIEATGRPGNDNLQKVYVLECDNCGECYGANGTDIFERKCPVCQGGQPGLPFA